MLVLSISENKTIIIDLCSLFQLLCCNQAGRYSYPELLMSRVHGLKLKGLVISLCTQNDIDSFQFRLLTKLLKAERSPNPTDKHCDGHCFCCFGKFLENSKVGNCL